MNAEMSREVGSDPALDDLRLLGGRPSVDFANTIDPREGDHRREYLRTYTDLAAWGARAGVLSAAAAGRLAQAARRDPRAAGRVFRRAVRLRETIYRAFAAVACSRRPTVADLEVLIAAYRAALAGATFVRAPDRFSWRLEETLDAVAAAVALDAVELLESHAIDRLKRCPGSGDCGWLFLDASRNGSRRWCSMEGCGNRAKARRHARRQRRRHRG